MKALALSGLGRSKEVLRAFLYCLALNPESHSVRKEAQKVWFAFSDFLFFQSCFQPLGPCGGAPVMSHKQEMGF